MSTTGTHRGQTETDWEVLLKTNDIENLPIEVRWIPLSPEESEERQKRLSLLLLKGAIKYSQSSTEDS